MNIFSNYVFLHWTFPSKNSLRPLHIKLLKSTMTILNNMGVKSDFINDFLEFLIKQKNNI